MSCRKWHGKRQAEAWGLSSRQQPVASPDGQASEARVSVECDDLGDRSAFANQENLAALTLQVGKAKRPHYPPAGKDNGGSLAGALQDLTGWRDAAELLRDLDPLLVAQPTADGPKAGSPA